MIDLARILRPPRYGYERDGRFYRPSAREILREYFYNLNVFRDRREWINVCNVLTHWGLLVPFVLTFTVYASVAHFAELAAYVVYLNVFGTVFLHRYGAQAQDRGALHGLARRAPLASGEAGRPLLRARRLALLLSRRRAEGGGAARPRPGRVPRGEEAGDAPGSPAVHVHGVSALGNDRPSGAHDRPLRAELG